MINHLSQSAVLSGGLAIAAGAVYAATEQPIWVLLAAFALLPLTLPELGSLGTTRETHMPLIIFLYLCCAVICVPFFLILKCATAAAFARVLTKSSMSLTTSEPCVEVRDVRGSAMDARCTFKTKPPS